MVHNQIPLQIFAVIAQVVERHIGNVEVTSSSLVNSLF